MKVHHTRSQFTNAKPSEDCGRKVYHQIHKQKPRGWRTSHLKSYPSRKQDVGVAASTSIFLILNKFLQAAQPLLRRLQNIIRLANGEAEIILDSPRILVRVELRRREGGHTQLLYHEPCKLEVPLSAGHMWREGIVIGQPDLAEVGHDEISAFWVREGYA